MESYKTEENMKLQKKLILLVTTVLLFTSAPLLGSQYKNYEEYNYNRLMQMASELGYVRVIVEMDVPNIEMLTALSTNYKTGLNKNKTFMQDAYNADLALEKAISTTRDSLLRRLNGVPYRVNREYSTIPFVAITVNQASLERLHSIPEVIRVVEDELTPHPGMEDVQTHTEDNLSQPLLNDVVNIVGADRAWSFGFTGAGWYVAVLDSGIRTSHEMFQGKQIIEHCFSQGFDPNDSSSGHCPNGLPEMDGPGSAAPYEPRFGHGTHVTGIAAGDNKVDRAGIAKGSDIIFINVFSFVPAWNDVGSWTSDQLGALNWLYAHRNDYRIASINMSLGVGKFASFCDNETLAAPIKNLYNAGIATVVASGNEGNCHAVSSPACVREAIAVANTDKLDNPTNHGNWDNEMVNLLAPGVNTNSSYSLGDDSYANSSGTSMAAPVVAGAWAVMKQLNANLTIDEILETLRITGTMITPLRCENMNPQPRINVGDAVQSLFSVAPPVNLSAEQETNKSFLQTEFINVLTWEHNPFNDDRTIINYRIYLVNNGGQLTSLAEVDGSTFTYWHRNVNKRETTSYGVTAVDDSGEESPPVYYTLDFGVTQE
jgi:subtilisin family serine protease